MGRDGTRTGVDLKQLPPRLKQRADPPSRKAGQKGVEMTPMAVGNGEPMEVGQLEPSHLASAPGELRLRIALAICLVVLAGAVYLWWAWQQIARFFASLMGLFL